MAWGKLRLHRVSLCGCGFLGGVLRCRCKGGEASAEWPIDAVTIMIM